MTVGPNRDAAQKSLESMAASVLETQDRIARLFERLVSLAAKTLSKE